MEAQYEEQCTRLLAQQRKMDSLMAQAQQKVQPAQPQQPQPQPQPQPPQPQLQPQPQPQPQPLASSPPPTTTTTRPTRPPPPPPPSLSQGLAASEVLAFSGWCGACGCVCGGACDPVQIVPASDVLDALLHVPPHAQPHGQPPHRQPLVAAASEVPASSGGGLVPASDVLDASPRASLHASAWLAAPPPRGQRASASGATSAVVKPLSWLEADRQFHASAAGKAFLASVTNTGPSTASSSSAAPAP